MLTSMGDAMREAHRRGWITTRDGNISVRRRDSFYITPSAGRKTIIEPEHILKAKIQSDGSLVWTQNYHTRPSGELEMHLMLQNVPFTDGVQCRAVVHLHPTYTIAAMLKGFNLRDLALEFPEVSRYTRVGHNVRVLPVTSTLLANETYEAMTDNRREGSPFGEIVYRDREIVCDIVGQDRHGVCAVARTPWDAFEHIERLEHICQIVLASGVSPK